MLPRDYMLYMEGNYVIIFVVNAAVLAAAICPLPHEGPECGIRPFPGELANSWRAFDLRIATNVLKET